MKAADLFNKNAALYQSKYMDVSLYHDSFDLFCDSIPKEDANILEIACGPGNITQYILRQRPDFRILGTDLAPNMLALAKINNPTAEFQLLDARDILKLDKKYDGVICGFCLPYLSKEEAIKLIGDAAQLLNPQGVLYISTMEDDYGKSGPTLSSTGDSVYMYYHQADYLEEALLENGFAVIDLQRKVYPDPNGKLTTDLLILAKR